MKLRHFLSLTNSLLFAALLVLPQLALSENKPLTEKTVTLRADQWAPFSGDPKSDAPGFMVEIAEKIFAKHGLKVEYELMPWTRVLKEVEAGHFDAAVGASPEDAPNFIYSQEPQGKWTVACIVLASNPWQYGGTIDSLSNVTAAASLGYVYGADSAGNDIDKYIEKNKGKSVEVLSGDFPLQSAIGMLRKKRVDVVLETPEVFFDAVKQLKLDPAEFRVAAEVRPRTPVWVGFSPNLPTSAQYAKMMQDGMIELRKSGELKKILDKYGIQDWQ